MVVESNAKNFQLWGVDVWCVNTDVGFRELATDIHDGVLRVGNHACVIFLTGRADTLWGRHFLAIVEKIIVACKRFGARSRFMFGGPFPHVSNGVCTVEHLACDRRYLEERLQGKPLSYFLRTAERFGDHRGVRKSLFVDEGLSLRSLEILEQDLLELFKLFWRVLQTSLIFDISLRI